MDFTSIMTELKEGFYRPIYFLYGEETFFIDKITDYIEQNALPENQKAFNQIVVYGKDTDIYTVIENARRFPMMHDRLVLIVKEAQNIKKIEELTHYAKKILKTTVLVINYKYKKPSKSLLKAIENAGGAVLEAKRLYDNKIPSWISNYVSEKGFKIDIQAAQMLTDFLGSDLSKVSNELDKLMIVLPTGTLITPEIIEQNIGISKDYNIFELQKALSFRDIEKANRIAAHFAANPKTNPFIKTVNQLFSFFVKVMLAWELKRASDREVASALGVHPFFVSQYRQAARLYSIKKLLYIISVLREYDMKAKGVGNVSANDGELLKELIFKILH